VQRSKCADARAIITICRAAGIMLDYSQDCWQRCGTFSIDNMSNLFTFSMA
jgi:hypothetical protein